MILHLDFSPGNILIKKTDENFIFKIVDINRMRFGEISLKQRLKSFSKLWAKDEDLRIIAKEYVRVASLTDGAVEEILNYSKTHKRVKNFKKWLKGQEVVD